MYKGIRLGDDFSIQILRHDGTLLPSHRYSPSAGASQIAATAMIGGFNKFTTRSSPVFIDTPLARLDIGHRDNLIDKFFPYASHQVVIFSTDSEIDEKYFPKMKPYLSRSYAMEFVPGEGRTKQHSGYFWNDSGEKTIAI